MHFCIENFHLGISWFLSGHEGAVQIRRFPRFSVERIGSKLSPLRRSGVNRKPLCLCMSEPSITCNLRSGQVQLKCKSITFQKTKLFLAPGGSNDRASKQGKVIIIRGQGRSGWGDWFGSDPFSKRKMY